MDYKIKYHDALEGIKELYNSDCDMIRVKRLRRRLEHIFPELAESEDEKIREALKQGFFEYGNSFTTFGGIQVGDILAWLEKQGNKSVNIDVESMVSSYEQRLESQGGTKYTPLVNMRLTAFRHGVENVLDELNLKKLEKQGEKKPADKVEPKFKVGNWIANGGANPCYVKSIFGDYYELCSCEGFEYTKPIKDVDYIYHLWTIQDAKDGDILVDEDNNIGLYLEEKDDLYWHSCIYLGCDNYLHGINIGAYHKHNNTKPATKEQCDMLFRKMKEEGYEWNAKKKEVKKPIDEVKPRFKEGDWITDGRITCKVLGVTGKSYDLHLHNDDYCHFETDIQCVDKYYRLWTIQDAKDGDVLVCEDENFTIPFIAIYKCLGDTVYNYKGLKDLTFNSHCFMGFNGNFYEGEGGHVIEGIHPATKEQRDLLFQKMKEAGYEWDSEKKELKKIEPKKVNADKVIEWLKDKIKETKECFGEHGVYYDTHLTLPYSSIEDLINDFKEDFGL